MILCFFKADIRQKNLLFWDWVFPVLLMIGASLFVKDSKETTGVLAGLLAFLILQTVIFGIPFRICEYLEKGTLQFVAEEGSVVKFLGSFFVTKMITVIVQCLLFLPIGSYLIHAKIDVRLFFFFLTLLTAMIIFGGIAIFISSCINNQQAAFGIAQLVYLILISTSGIFYPLEKSPQILQTISLISPLTYIKNLVYYSIDKQSNQLIYPILIISILLIIGIILFYASYLVLSKKLNGRNRTSVSIK